MSNGHMASHCFNPFTGDITGLFEANQFGHSYISPQLLLVLSVTLH
jgi:hypothetical protein